MQRFEIVVIGAGIVGAFVAQYLSSEGAQVALLDRKHPGQEASGVNAGTLAAQNKPLELIPMAMDGIRLWQEFEASSGIDLETELPGGLRVAHDEEGVHKLQEACEMQQAKGLNIKHITGDEAREVAPYLSESILAANWSEIDGYNNALIATVQVVQQALRNGATLLARTEVTSLKRHSAGWELQTNAGPIEARCVVLAAGFWVRGLLKPLGIDLPLHVRNNQMMVTSAVPPLIHHVITHVSGRLTLKQKHVGTVLIGGGWPGHHDEALRLKWPSLRSMSGNAKLACETIPALRNLQIIRAWAGIDGRAVHQEPYIGPIQHLEGLYLATTCWGAYTLAPAIACGVTHWMLNGKAAPGMDQFDADRQLSRDAA
jgi:glycine/D-amino acid oxidase-like deaminating enzyme